MENFTEIPAKSELLDDGLRQEIAGVFTQINGKVIAKAVVSNNQKDRELVSLLKDMASFNDNFQVEFSSAGGQAELEEQVKTEGRTPVTGLFKEDGTYTGISFHGVPGGKELSSFLMGCYHSVNPEHKMSWGLKHRLKKWEQETDIKVFVSLSCHHCAKTVIAAGQLAAASPQIQAAMIDANLYPELVEKYSIERVPMTVIDDSKILMGEKSMEDIMDFMEKNK